MVWGYVILGAIAIGMVLLKLGQSYRRQVSEDRDEANRPAE